MKRQQDFFELLCVKPNDFDCTSFLTHFGAYRFTRLAGFREIINSALVVEGGFSRLNHALAAVKGTLGAASKELPEALKKAMPHGDWIDCHGDQVDSAWSGEALRFDKACMVIKALELALRRESSSVLNALDVYRFITLHPAIYALRNLEIWRLLFDVQHRDRLHDSELRIVETLKASLMPNDDHGRKVCKKEYVETFISQAIHGSPITWHSAEIFCKSFEPGSRSKGVSSNSTLLARSVIAEQLTSRNDGGKRTGKKLCSQNEGPFIGLSTELLDELARFCRA
jgi:hypothetical protein